MFKRSAFLVFLVSCALTLQAGDARAADDLGPLEIKPSPKIDPNLFLLRVLETVYSEWPRATDTSSMAVTWSVDQKLQTQRLIAHAKKMNRDANVIALLEDALGLFKRHQDYLVETGAIAQSALDRASVERGQMMEKGVGRFLDRAMQKGDTKEGRKQVAKETLGDLAAGLVVDVFQQAQRNAAKRAALERARQNFETVFSTTRGRCATTARRIAAAQTWAAGEAGFEDIKLTDQVRRRPRDPFIQTRWASIRLEKETAAHMMKDARVCVEAARLVPEGLVHDGYRARFLAVAGGMAERAASRQWFSESGNRYGTDLAKEAVRICRTRLLYDPDPTDWGKYDLAMSLNFAGRHAEALNQASEAKKLHRYSGFAYFYACLLSLNGQTKMAMEWLTFAFKLGYSNVAWAKKDPELANLRRDQVAAFARLTKVEWKWSISYGLVKDDVVLVNNSVFPLTNIVLDARITKGVKVWTPRLTLAYLAPGASYKWVNVFSIPGSRTDSSTATLVSDQTK